MGYEDIKTVSHSAVTTFDLNRAVRAATASFRDEFRQILGSEPIVENDKEYFRICTYGAGHYEIVGQFALAELHGCCGVVVFYHASTTPKFQKKGLGSLFLKIRQKAAILAGYSVGQATVLKTNKSEIKLLQSEGWKDIHVFANKRTHNEVLVFVKSL